MPHRIRVNGLALGWMDTPGEGRVIRLYHGAQDGWREKAEKDLPFGRMLKTDEVARAIAFLASEESGMMTGAIIDFDQFVLGSYHTVPRPVPATGASWRELGRNGPPDGQSTIRFERIEDQTDGARA